MGKLSGCAATLCVIAALTFAGCSTLYQQAVVALRQPGERIADTPARVWREFDCGNRERPFVRAESMEVVPERIKPGGRVNYRLIYVMCPVKPSEVIKTQVSRKMLFQGQQVAANIKEAFEIKPGRWVVDSFFTLPVNSPSGVYALELSFDAPSGQVHKKSRSFIVSNESYLSRVQ